MRSMRFIAMFISYYVSSFAVTAFCVFAAQLLGNASILFLNIVLTIFLTLIFSWLYFKGVPSITWRQRTEAIGVWFGLMLLTDLLVLTQFYGYPLSSIGSVSVATYALQILALFVAAYVTANSHPRLAESPDLLIQE